MRAPRGEGGGAHLYPRHFRKPAEGTPPTVRTYIELSWKTEDATETDPTMS